MNPKKKIWETLQVDLHTDKDLVACYKDLPFTTSAGVCTFSSISDGSIGWTNDFLNYFSFMIWNINLFIFSTYKKEYYLVNRKVKYFLFSWLVCSFPAFWKKSKSQFRLEIGISAHILFSSILKLIKKRNKTFFVL